MCHTDGPLADHHDDGRRIPVYGLCEGEYPGADFDFCTSDDFHSAVFPACMMGRTPEEVQEKTVINKKGASEWFAPGSISKKELIINKY